MARLLGILLLVGLVWLGLRWLFNRVAVARRAAEVPRFEKTVRCARCGAHMPLALARAEGDVYVCRAHESDSHESRRS
jgi:formylmethanofuran dehydrogenase subunit E